MSSLNSQIMTVHPRGFLTADTLTEEARERYAGRLDSLNSQLDQIWTSAEVAFKSIDERIAARFKSDEILKHARTVVLEIRKLRDAEFSIIDRDRAAARRAVPTALPVTIEGGAVGAQVFYQKNQMILDLLRSHASKASRMALVLASAQRGEPEALLALQTAPPIVRTYLIDDEDLEKCKAAYWEVHEPAAVKALRAVDEHESTVIANVRLALSKLAKGQDLDGEDVEAMSRRAHGRYAPEPVPTVAELEAMPTVG